MVATLRPVTMCVVSALLESDQLTLPLTLVNFWQPLLQLFHQSHATPLLLEKLLQLQTDSRGLQDRLVVGWVAAVVTAIQEGGLYKQHFSVHETVKALGA